MTGKRFIVLTFRELGGDSASVPFGRIRRDDVMSARDILDELAPLAKRAEESDKER